MLTPNDIEKYFVAEKQAGLVFLIIGMIAIVLGLVFIFVFKTPFFKGAAIPLIVIGLIQAIAGTTIFRRSDGDRIRNVYAYKMDPSSLREKELPRMNTVNKNFMMLKVVEIIIIIAALFLIFYFRSNPDYIFWHGLGITLFMQALLILGADIMAETRAHLYTEKLAVFVENNGTAQR